MKIRVTTTYEIPYGGFPLKTADVCLPVTWREFLRRGRIEVERIDKCPLGEARATTIYELMED
jgi:hypothetical protein